MTFYWWSHWFWITLYTGVLLSVLCVGAFPSQEISIEYNQNSKTLKTVTKLYRSTTTTLAWATATTAPDRSQFPVLESAEIAEPNSAELRRKEVDAHRSDSSTEGLSQGSDEEAPPEVVEYKRSAEEFNKTSDVNVKKKTAAEAEPPSLVHQGKEVVLNNYTNFSSAASEQSGSRTNANGTFAAQHVTSLNATEALNSTLSAQESLVAPAAAPSTPKIESFFGASEWINTSGQMPREEGEEGDNATAASVLSATGVVHRVPFTLENANKEEELRRAETEHRSRKSKVLSAEYKHINRFINYSTDSKNLLTRSASSAPNEYDNDEGNISSEALAIQRTYFLDAGAISAICFTVFGICCAVGTLGIVLYRRRYLNKPQALSEPDSSVYIDDSTMRDNSDEMYSLDNDSFLNSLEAMTIQNYWTDTVKHTKL